MQVCLGGKLRVNHTSKCMLSEVDWGAHETHQNGHIITELDFGGQDPSLCLPDGADALKLIGEVMIQVFTLWMHACTLKLIRELTTQVSSFTLSSLTMMETQMTSSFMHFGENYHKEHLPPLSWSI